MEKIRLLIVEDSKMMQQVLKTIFAMDSDIAVVGTANEPFTARELIKELHPDIITLDIMMPMMDGITFLKNLMRLHPIPVVMISGLTEKNSPIALEALALGAVEYVNKPTTEDLNHLKNYADNLIKIVKLAAKANVKEKAAGIPKQQIGFDISQTILKSSDILKQTIIAMGASTGGIEAIEHLLVKMPKVSPAIVIAQHIRREFSVAFAQRINRLCSMIVTEAKEGDEILPGHVYIAPGSHNLAVVKRNHTYFCHLTDEIIKGTHKPSVDILFKSVAKVAGNKAIGVLLTGMGSDGVEGMRAIKNAGGITLAQDEQTSVVWGMPGAAVRADIVDHVVPLHDIPPKLLSILDHKLRAQLK